MFGQKILKIHCIDIGLVRVQVFSLMLQRSSSISVHTGGYAEEILLKDSSLSVNVKSSGFSIAKAWIALLILVMSCIDNMQYVHLQFTSQVCELNILLKITKRRSY